MQELVQQLRQDLDANKPIRLFDYLSEIPEASKREVLFELLNTELQLRREQGESPEITRYLEELTGYADIVQRCFDDTCRFQNDETQTMGQVVGGDVSIDHNATIDHPIALDHDATLDRDATLDHRPSPSPTRSRSNQPLPDIPGYRIIREIARGGMGIVYQAEQTKLNRVCALKMILGNEFASEEDIKRFHFEAEASANLDHPNIVPIFDIGVAGRLHYFSMGFIDGGSLAALLKTGPLLPNDAANYTLKIAQAIGYAHSKGVIHRDLKPANVLLDRRSEPKVTDFGLARKLDDDSGLTRTGAIMGTPSFMAPEQAAGNTDAIDARSDIYSIGAILYNLLTGRPPFQGPSVVDTISQVLTKEALAPRNLVPSIPKDLETICLKCLEKTANKRYQTATELIEDIERYQRGEPVKARPITGAERLHRWIVRNPEKSIVAAVSTCACMAILALVVWNSFRISNIRQEEALAKAKLEARGDAAQYYKAFSQARERLSSPAPGWINSNLIDLREVFEFNESQTELPEIRSLLAATLLGTEIYNTERFSFAKTVNRGIAWNPTGTMFACGANTAKAGLIEIWVFEVAADGSYQQVKTLTKSHSLTSLFKLATDGINSAHFSHNGKRLYVGSRSGYLYGWHVADWTPCCEIRAHDDNLNSIVEVQPGKVVTGSKDKTVKIWETQSGKELASYKYDSIVSQVSEAADHLVVWAGNVHFIPKKTKDSPSGYGDSKEWLPAISALTVHPSLNAIVVSNGTSLKTYEFGRSEPSREIFPQSQQSKVANSIQQLAFSSDGRYVLALDRSSITVWDYTSGSVVSEYGVPGSEGAVVAPRPLKTDEFLLVANKKVEGWAIRFSDLVRPSLSVPMRIRQAALTSDGRYAIGTSYVWANDVAPGYAFYLYEDLTLDLKMRVRIGDHEGAGIDVTPDGKHLFIVGQDKEILRSELENHAVDRFKINFPLRHIEAESAEGVWCLGENEATPFLKGRAAPGMVAWRDMTKGENAQEFVNLNSQLQLGESGFLVPDWRDGHLVVANRDGILRLFARGSNEPLKAIQTAGKTYGPVGFYGGTEFVALGTPQGSLQCYSLATEKLIAEFPTFDRAVTALATNDEQIACASDNGEVSLYQVKQNGELSKWLSFQLSRSRVVKLQYSGDGKKLLVHHVDDAGVWIFDTAQLQRRLAEFKPMISESP